MGKGVLGEANPRLYNSWRAMKARCGNPNDKSYPYYGGRGISVCEEWAGFQQFMEWAIVSGYHDGLTIDRIDVNGNYCPGNCRWATRMEQVNNARSNRHIEFNGETHTIGEWALITGINHFTLRNRLTYYGWSAERALTTKK